MSETLHEIRRGEFITTVEVDETDVTLTEDADFFPTCGCRDCGPAQTKDVMFFDDPDEIEALAKAMLEGADRLRE